MLRTVGSIINNYKIREVYISFLTCLALLSKKDPLCLLESTFILSMVAKVIFSLVCNMACEREVGLFISNDSWSND